MSQAALNSREPSGSPRSRTRLRRNNGMRLAGMLFLLLVLAGIGWGAGW